MYACEGTCFVCLCVLRLTEMLKTILLLDGSEAMNSSSDYLPSYLLAMRPPLLRFVSQYLNATPLALLGVVVMRNGVADRLCPCTTNASELADTLERDYFLYGGAGVTSLENGLRMALSELVDLKKAVSLSKSDAAVTASVHRQTGAAQLHIVIVSASVTFIDPTDVFRVIATMATFRIVMDVVSLTGAVHVFDECARQTGGHLYCPLNYDHLFSIMHTLGVGRARSGGLRRPRKRPRGGESKGEEEKVPMVAVGFPVYVHRTTGDTTTTYLACPQCHFIQTSIPSTCPLCKLLLCNVCLTYSTFVSHNSLAASTTEVPIRDLLRTHDRKPSSQRQEEHIRCSLCDTHCGNPKEGGTFYACRACHCLRCSSCDLFVRESLGMCPGCVASK